MYPPYQRAARHRRYCAAVGIFLVLVAGSWNVAVVDSFLFSKTTTFSTGQHGVQCRGKCLCVKRYVHSKSLSFLVLWCFLASHHQLVVIYKLRVILPSTRMLRTVFIVKPTDCVLYLQHCRPKAWKRWSNRSASHRTKVRAPSNPKIRTSTLWSRSRRVTLYQQKSAVYIFTRHISCSRTAFISSPSISFLFAILYSVAVVVVVVVFKVVSK